MSVHRNIQSEMSEMTSSPRTQDSSRNWLHEGLPTAAKQDPPPATAITAATATTEYCCTEHIDQRYFATVASLERFATPHRRAGTAA